MGCFAVGAKLDDAIRGDTADGWLYFEVNSKSPFPINETARPRDTTNETNCPISIFLLINYNLEFTLRLEYHLNLSLYMCIFSAGTHFSGFLLSYLSGRQVQ